MKGKSMHMATIYCETILYNLYALILMEHFNVPCVVIVLLECLSYYKC